MRMNDKTHHIVGRIETFFANRAMHMVALSALYLLLLVEYRRFVYRYYYYLMGFEYSSDPVAFMTGLLLFALLMATMYFGHARGRLYAMGMAVALLFCLPSIVMYQLAGAAPYGAVYSLLLLVLLQTPLLEIPSWRVPRLSTGWLRWLLPVAAVLGLVPFVAAYGYRPDLSVLSLGSEIYDVRASLGGKGNLLTAYLLGPMRLVVLPMLIVCGLRDFRRQWWMALLGAGLLLYLFLLNPQKSILFSIGVVLLFYLFRDFRAKAGLLLGGLLAVCAATVLLNIVTGNLMAESIAVRRLFFIPALVSDTYFTFFSGAPVHLSHSFLSHFGTYPYEADPSHLIGYVMYNRTITSCNTGIVADGFMNFGHLGALLFTALGAVVLRLASASEYDSRYFGLVVLLIFCFLNSALFTTMLTHGGFVLLVALWFLIPRQEAAV